MSDNQGRAVAGSLAGGLGGGLIGLVLGGFLGPFLAGVPMDSREGIQGIFDTCFGTFFMLLGATVGGVSCAILGAAIGAGRATSTLNEQSPPGRIEPRPAHFEDESIHTEMDRLERRMKVLKASQQKKPPIDDA